MTAPSVFNDADWYWVVGDHNPTTEVYSTASNAYVANNAAAFLTWLSAPTHWGTRREITNAVDDGTGKVRLTTDSSGMQTGQVWNINEVGGTTEANGNFVITVINATTIDLDTVSFVHAYTSGGFIQGPTIIDTNANLYERIDSIARSKFKNSYATYSTGSNIVLTNPPPTLVEVTASANINLTLPAMNTVNSLPVGWPFEIRSLTSSGAFTVTIKDSAASTITIIDGGSAARAVINSSNLTAAGSFSFMRLDKVALSASAADLQTGTLAAARLPQFTGGDVTTSGAGVIDLQIGANVVGNAEIRQSAALSVVGRGANSTGNVADISATAASGAVLRESGSTIGFGTIGSAGIAANAVDTSQINNNAVTDAKLRDSAAVSVIGRSANSSGDPADIAAGADGNVLRRSSSTVGFGTIDLTSATTVAANAWSSSTPTPTSTGGAFTTASSSIHYQIIGKKLEFLGSATLTTIGGSASGQLLITLPATSAISGATVGGNATTLVSAFCFVTASSATLSITPTRAFTNGEVYYFGGVIETT